MIDDEISRLRSMLKNAHELPRANPLRKFAGLIANKFGGRKKLNVQSDEKQKTKKTAA